MNQCMQCKCDITGVGKVFCSQKCNAAHRSERHAERRASIQRTCAACGANFCPPRHSSRETCSKECQYALVSATHKTIGTKPTDTRSPEQQRQQVKGANAPWWKGGRHLNDRGYVMVIAPDDFPFPGMLDRHRRIREHRMVMALHLGRELRRSEVVHHLNHDRTDNRLENLHLYGSHSEHMRSHAHAVRGDG
jgi:hypothetical protein